MKKGQFFRGTITSILGLALLAAAPEIASAKRKMSKDEIAQEQERERLEDIEKRRGKDVREAAERRAEAEKNRKGLKAKFLGLGTGACPNFEVDEDVGFRTTFVDMVWNPEIRRSRYGDYFLKYDRWEEKLGYETRGASENFMVDVDKYVRREFNYARLFTEADCKGREGFKRVFLPPIYKPVAEGDKTEFSPVLFNKNFGKAKAVDFLRRRMKVGEYLQIRMANQFGLGVRFSEMGFAGFAQAGLKFAKEGVSTLKVFKDGENSVTISVSHLGEQYVRASGRVRYFPLGNPLENLLKLSRPVILNFDLGLKGSGDLVAFRYDLNNASARNALEQVFEWSHKPIFVDPVVLKNIVSNPLNVDNIEKLQRFFPFAKSEGLAEQNGSGVKSMLDVKTTYRGSQQYGRLRFGHFFRISTEQLNAEHMLDIRLYSDDYLIRNFLSSDTDRQLNGSVDTGLYLAAHVYRRDRNRLPFQGGEDQIWNIAAIYKVDEGILSELTEDMSDKKKRKIAKKKMRPENFVGLSFNTDVYDSKMKSKELDAMAQHLRTNFGHLCYDLDCGQVTNIAKKDKVRYSYSAYFPANYAKLLRLFYDRGLEEALERREEMGFFRKLTSREVSKIQTKMKDDITETIFSWAKPFAFPVEDKERRLTSDEETFMKRNVEAFADGLFDLIFDPDVEVPHFWRASSGARIQMNKNLPGLMIAAIDPRLQDLDLPKEELEKVKQGLINRDVVRLRLSVNTKSGMSHYSSFGATDDLNMAEVIAQTIGEVKELLDKELNPVDEKRLLAIRKKYDDAKYTR